MPPKKVAGNNSIVNTSSNSKRKNGLQEFLGKHNYDKNVHQNGYTNTRIGDKKLQVYGGTFYIPDEKYEEFLKLYYNDVVAKKKKEYLTEKQLTDEGAIAIDLDFRHELQTDERQYTFTHIISFIDLYVSKIEGLFELIDEDVQIPIYVLEKPKVNQMKEKNITKDGIHLIIGLKCNRIIQQIIRNFVIDDLPSIFDDIPMIDDWSYEDVFDDCITSGNNCWQLYGSRKPGYDKYELTHVFQLTLDIDNQEFVRNEIPLNEFDIESNIYKMSVRYPDHDSLMMNSKCVNLYQELKTKNEKRKNETQMLQNNLSNNLIADVTSFEHILSNCDSKENIEKLFMEFMQHTSRNRDEQDVYNIARYVNILPKSFYGLGSYSNWIKTCWALKHASIEFGNPYKLFIVWLYFSSKSDTFDVTNGVQECLEKWNSANVASNGDRYRGITRMSIYHWAKEHAYDEYKDILSTNLDYHIEETLISIDGEGDCSLANVMHQWFKHEFICTHTKTNNWYVYEGHSWKEDDGGNEIRSKINLDLKHKYFKRTLDLLPSRNVDLTDLGDEDEEEKLKTKNKLIRCHKIMQKCASSTGKSKIHRELSEVFRDKGGEFMEAVDKDPYLFCCKNGVLDFREKTFRPGRPDDYITKYTKIEYVELNRAKHGKTMDEIEDFMKKLFPIPELCKYMWEHLASLLIGVTPDQTFNIYIGEGQNGKSVLINLIQRIMGSYTKDVQTTLITDKKQKMGQANPEYASFPGVRYLCMTESDETEELNEGIMKQLTGGDKLTARGLYEKKIIEFVPQFKLILACNRLPPVKATDHGTWRRIRAVPFLSLFTENPKQDDKLKPYQFKVDRTIESKFDTWAPVMLSMLAKIAFETNGRVKDCDTVLEKCRQYKNDSDTLARFLEERVIQSEGSFITKTQINQDFNIWYEDNNNSHDKRKKPTARKIAEAVNKLYGQPKGNVWPGIALKEENEGLDFSNEFVTKVSVNEL